MSNLIANGKVVDDEWTLVKLPPPPDEKVRKQAGKVVLFKLTGENTHTNSQIESVEIPPEGKVLLPLPLWTLKKQELSNRVSKGEIGVWLETHELVESLSCSISDINKLPVIGVHVERFADGRIFTIGNLLRSRYGFKNELRAFGDVLRDQLYFLKRCGFDSYLIRNDRSAADALASLNDFSEPYQGAVDITQPVWRRIDRQG